jgi:NAD(P)-dependent dehydrogenase (short-subunit alcohol dehydrogenase family)
MADDDMAGRVVVVTGATRGIGRDLALYLAQRGVRLAVTGRKQQRLDDVRSEIAACGEEPVARAVNAADRRGTFALVEEAVARFGRIDGLVANAQTFRPVTPLEEVTESDMDILVETGPKGTLWAMQAVFPHMRELGWGRIVTMGSNGALLGSAGFGPYAASKEGIRALTRVAAREWGRYGIVVNCVCPVSVAHRSAPTEPERVAAFAATFAEQPIARDGDTQTDIAPVIAFLLSEGCRYMTGQTIMADGGAIMLR